MYARIGCGVRLASTRVPKVLGAVQDVEGWAPTTEWVHQVIVSDPSRLLQHIDYLICFIFQSRKILENHGVHFSVFLLAQETGHNCIQGNNAGAAC